MNEFKASCVRYGHDEDELVKGMGDLI